MKKADGDQGLNNKPRLSKQSYIEDINSYLDSLHGAIDGLDREDIDAVMNAIYAAYMNDTTVYVFGNGGSASTASHMLNDFNKGISESKEKKFRFQCLNDNIPIMLAIANDNGYEAVFEQQLTNKLDGSELIIAVSVSGNSANIIRAVTYAKSCGCKVIAITGHDGGRLKKLADHSLRVCVDNIQIAEDIHMIFNHMMMYIFCKRLA